MELQWPLILFTTFVAWSAGLFGTQALLALQGAAKRSQLAAWICSAVLLAVGGIAVFFHLEHWERIFNGFGHLTSGITQELIAIVVLAIVAIVYLVMLRKSEDGGSVPKAVSVIAIAVSIVLIAVMAHSYTMAARPAWDSVFWILYVLGNACVFGPATMAVIMAACKDDSEAVKVPFIVGAAVAVLTAVAFAIYLQSCSGSFSEVGMHFDNTHPMNAMADVAQVAAGIMPILWAGAVVVGAGVPVVCACLGRFTARIPMAACGAVAVATTLLGAVCMRVAFYEMGLSVFMYY